MEIFKRVVNKVLYTQIRLKWYIDYFRVRNQISFKRNVISLSRGVKLILLPHVDDEWIGCSQIINNYPNVVLCDMDMPGGDSQYIHKKRKEELKKLCDTKRISSILLDNNKVGKLTEIIKETGCSEIFLPYLVDWHPEHLKVHDIVASVLENIDSEINIVMYQVSVPISDNHINLVMPMDKQAVKNKWTLFGYFYPSQKYLPSQRFLLQERINGAYADSYAAEVYCIKSKNEWLSAKNSFVLSFNKRKSIVSSLNHIYKLRNIVKSIDSNSFNL